MGTLRSAWEERYLVVAPQGLGDSLEATPIVAGLKRARPEVPIDVVVLRPGPRELFGGMPKLVAEVIYLPYWEKGRAAFAAELLGACRRRRYTASFLAYPAARREYHLMTRMFGARRRFAHRYDGRALWSLQWLHTDLVEVRDHHTILRNLDLLEAAGLPASRDLTYVVPAQWRSGERHERRIAVHPGTIAHDGLDAKRWPAERFASLAARLAGDGYEVHLISGPAERDLVATIADRVRPASVFEGSLAEVARFLSSCAAVVSNDSGIAHLAAAVGAPVIALHGPTTVHGGPYGERAVAFRPSPCPPCFDPRRLDMSCALGIDYACLKRDMPADLVYSRLRSLLIEGLEFAHSGNPGEIRPLSHS
ncbi:MAG: glycosyltransferase family 9 protein [bacterium]|nr:glycosyltransferase family 9 protein [bacterium]